MDIYYKPITELSEKIKTGELSPVSLTEKFIERLSELGPRFNSIVTLTEERALEEAELAEKEIREGIYFGPLHGIPYGVKDLLAAEGYPTTWGAAPFTDRIFDYDSTIVRHLGKSGAILCAKLAMIELAGGMGYNQPNASFTGPPKNPWNPEYWTGGSSSGSGAAVAAGMVPFSIGSETWGSILSPANNCGVTGLRPTYGRVSRYGSMPLSWTLDKLGPLCLTAQDCGIVLEAIAGRDPNDTTTINKSYSFEMEETDNFRLATLKNIKEDLDPDVAENFEDSMTKLEYIGSIEEIEFTDLPYESVARIILYAEAASAFDDFIKSGKARMLTAPEDRYGPYSFTIIQAKDYLKAMRIRNVMSREADEIMSSYDAVIAPARSRPAGLIDEEFRKEESGKSRDIMGALGNLAGLPAIAVPNGFTDKGLPTGIQFMGRAYDENKIISIADSYQNLTDWHKKHPEL